MSAARRGMTAAEKIIARTCGMERVQAGDIVFPQPDMVMIHDNMVPSVKRVLDELGIDRLAQPEKVVMVTDHEVLYGSARAAQYGSINRGAAKRWQVGRFFDVGRGGHGHVFPMEMGMLLPGMFYFDNDRHCTNAGAIGAVGFRMGLEIARVLATGTNWIMVPRTLKLTLSGNLAAYWTCGITFASDGQGEDANEAFTFVPWLEGRVRERGVFEPLGRDEGAEAEVTLRATAAQSAEGVSLPPLSGGGACGE